MWRIHMCEGERMADDERFERWGKWIIEIYEEIEQSLVNGYMG